MRSPAFRERLGRFVTIAGWCVALGLLSVVYGFSWLLVV